MPKIPNHPCSHPGCPRLIPRGKKYCHEHIAMHPEKARPPAARGYDARWNRARKKFLEAHPLCVECMKNGKYTKATDVDHIVPHRGDLLLFWDQENWQALCKACHDLKTGKGL